MTHQPELLGAPVVFREGAQNWLDTYKPTADASMLPNVLARCPMFAALKSRKKGRVMLDKHGQAIDPLTWHELPCHVAGDKVEQYGHQLRQEHLTLWLIFIKMSLQEDHQTSHANMVFFSKREMLRRLGHKTVGGKDALDLRELLEDMKHTDFRITTAKVGHKINCSLINTVFENGIDGRFGVELDQRLVKLFVDGVTSINIDERKLLDGKQTKNVVAQWLHAFYSTHRDPQEFVLEKLQKLSGRTGDIYEFKKAVISAITLINDTLPNWYCSLSPQGKFRVAHGKDGSNARQARVTHTAELEKMASAKAARAAKKQKKLTAQATPSIDADIFAAPAPESASGEADLWADITDHGDLFSRSLSDLILMMDVAALDEWVAYEESHKAAPETATKCKIAALGCLDRQFSRHLASLQANRAVFDADNIDSDC